jgi:hypothetical protein
MQMVMPLASAWLGEDLQVFHDERPLDFLLGGFDGIGLADHGVNRTDHTRTAHCAPLDR